MVTPRTLVVCVTLLSVAAGGCGTMTNLATPVARGEAARVYGGVENDVRFAGGILACPWSGLPLIGPSNGQPDDTFTWLALAPVFLTLTAIDLPMSLVGDTLTLPRVLSASAPQPAEVPSSVRVPEYHANQRSGVDRDTADRTH